MYVGVLRLQLSNGFSIVGFAADIVIVSVAKMVKEIQEKTNISIGKAGRWLDEAGLTLAAHKTEAVLISGRKIVEKMEATVGGFKIESKWAIKYVAVIIDDRLNFKVHWLMRKGIRNTESTDEDDAKYWRTMEGILSSNYILCYVMLYYIMTSKVYRVV